MQLILAATGHRPEKLGGYAPHLFRATRAYAMACLYELRPSEVISGMALGWDMAIADAAITLGIPVRAAIPFRGQEATWPEGSQQRYHRLLSQAVKVIEVSDPPDEYHFTFSDVFQRRNEYMVDECDRLLALWDGSPGGTANCVRYAEQVKCATLNVWDAFWKNNIPF